MTDCKARPPRRAQKPTAEAPQPARLTCRTCRFWEHPVRDIDEALIPVSADCRRHAPAALWPGNDGLGDGAAWPRTKAKDWCGDAEPIDEALAAERAAARERYENSPFYRYATPPAPGRRG